MLVYCMNVRTTYARNNKQLAATESPIRPLIVFIILTRGPRLFVPAALVRITRAAPRGSSFLPACNAPIPPLATPPLCGAVPR